MSELLQAIDRGEVGALILLDLTAAFGTVDHDILLQQTRLTFDIRSTLCYVSLHA